MKTKERLSKLQESFKEAPASGKWIGYIGDMRSPKEKKIFDNFNQAKKWKDGAESKHPKVGIAAVISLTPIEKKLYNVEFLHKEAKFNKGDRVVFNTDLSAGRKDGKPVNPIKKGTKAIIIEPGNGGMVTVKLANGKIQTNIVPDFLNKESFKEAGEEERNPKPKIEPLPGNNKALEDDTDVKKMNDEANFDTGIIEIEEKIQSLRETIGNRERKLISQLLNVMGFEQMARDVKTASESDVKRLIKMVIKDLESQIKNFSPDKKAKFQKQLDTLKRSAKQLKLIEKVNYDKFKNDFKKLSKTDFLKKHKNLTSKDWEDLNLTHRFRLNRGQESFKKRLEKLMVKNGIHDKKKKEARNPEEIRGTAAHDALMKVNTMSVDQLARTFFPSQLMKAAQFTDKGTEKQKLQKAAIKGQESVKGRIEKLSENFKEQTFRVGDKVKNKKTGAKGVVVDRDSGLFGVKTQSGIVMDIFEKEEKDWVKI